MWVDACTSGRQRECWASCGAPAVGLLQHSTGHGSSCMCETSKAVEGERGGNKNNKKSTWSETRTRDLARVKRT